MRHYQHDVPGAEQRPPGADRILAALGGRIGEVSLRTTRTAVTTELFPSEIVDAEMPDIARRSFPLVLGSLRDGRTPGEDELAMLRDRAAQRAREGVPLTLLIHIWQHGFQEFFEEAGRLARPGEARALGWIGVAMMRLQEMFLAEMVTAYQAERETLTEERSGAVPLIARLLILGQDPRADAERLGVVLAERYDVLALHLTTPATPTTGDDGAGSPQAREVTDRRRLHRMLALLRTGGGPATLSLLNRAGGYLLIPRTDDGTRATTHVPDRPERLIAGLRSAAGVPILAAAVENAPVGGVADAARQADEVLDLVRVQEREPGVYRLADVFLAHQLSRPGPGLDDLVAATAAVFGQADLRVTLQAYFDCDLDRQRTARRLGVHPNTVNNRLNRVAELSPHSPFTVRGITALAAALTIDRLRAAGTGGATDADDPRNR